MSWAASNGNGPALKFMLQLMIVITAGGGAFADARGHPPANSALCDAPAPGACDSCSSHDFAVERVLHARVSDFDFFERVNQTGSLDRREF